MGRASSTHGREMHTMFLYANLKEGDPLGRLRHSYKDNIKMNLKGIWCEGVRMDEPGLKYTYLKGIIQ
jgi:hypothetical protein